MDKAAHKEPGRVKEPNSDPSKSLVTGTICLAVIGQVVWLLCLLLRSLQEESNTASWVLISLFSLIALGVSVFLLRYVFFPPTLEKRFLSSYILLHLWRTFFTLGFTVAIWSLLFQVSSIRGWQHKAFLTLWITSGIAFVVVLTRQIRRYQKVETYDVLEQRLRKGNFYVVFGGRTHAPVHTRRRRRMRLPDVPWFLLTGVTFIAIGLSLLTIVSVAIAKGEWTNFLFVPLVFGLVFSIAPSYWVLALLECLLARTITPWPMRAARDFFTKKEMVSSKSAFGELFLFGFAALVFALFSLSGLSAAMADWGLDYETLVQLGVGFFCLFAGMSVLGYWIEKYRAERRRKERKSNLNAPTITQVHKGLIVIAHCFGWIVLALGLGVVLAIGWGNGFRAHSLGRAVLMPCVSILWVWYVLSALIHFHAQLKPYYPSNWSLPFPVRLSDLVALGFQRVPMLSFFALLFGALQLAAGKIQDDRKRVSQHRATGPFDLLQAKTIADRRASTRRGRKYCFALENGYEGITFDDPRAHGWRFHYCLPEKGKQFEVVVGKTKTVLRKSQDLPAPTPGELANECIHPQVVTEKVRQTLAERYAEGQIENMTLFLHLPASRFPGGPQTKPNGPLAWLVDVYDSEMKPVHDYTIECEKSQLL